MAGRGCGLWPSERRAVEVLRDTEEDDPALPDVGLPEPEAEQPEQVAREPIAALEYTYLYLCACDFVYPAELHVWIEESEFTLWVSTNMSD